MAKIPANAPIYIIRANGEEYFIQYGGLEIEAECSSALAGKLENVTYSFDMRLIKHTLKTASGKTLDITDVENHA